MGGQSILKNKIRAARATRLFSLLTNDIVLWCCHCHSRRRFFSPGQTIEQSWIQHSNFARSSIVRLFGRPCWKMFVQHFLFDQVLDRLCFLIKLYAQQFCSTQPCCSVLPLFQQSCILLANHESLRYFQAKAFGIIFDKDGGRRPKGYHAGLLM